MVNCNVIGEVSAISSEFQWVIDRFSTACKNVGDKLISPTFTTANINRNIQWHMSLYPKGINEQHKDYLSIYICPSTDTVATATIELRNNHGRVIVCNWIIESKQFLKTGTGYDNFLERKFIYDPVNDILNDNKITIICKITLSDDKLAVHEKKLTPEEEKKNILQSLVHVEKYEALMNDDRFSDFSLISEGKEVKGHKCILAKSSTIFARMFDTDMKEKQCNTVEITDIKYDVLVEMIRFVYAGKVNNIDALAGELAEAADKYALDVLKNMCEMAMSKNLSIDNVLLSIELADRCRMEMLKKNCIMYIVTNANVVTKKTEFNLLPSNLLCEICRALIKKIVI